MISLILDICVSSSLIIYSGFERIDPFVSPLTSGEPDVCELFADAFIFLCKIRFLFILYSFRLFYYNYNKGAWGPLFAIYAWEI